MSDAPPPFPTAALLAGLAVVAFLPALGAGFVADDFLMLQTVDAANGPLWPFGRNDLGQDGDAGHFYRPLWVLMNAGVHAVFGDDPLAFHVLNLLLFAVLTVEVWALGRALLPPAAALLAAVAFALYPRHAESVAWVSGNTDLLAVGLVLASLLCLLAPWRPSLRFGAAAALAVLGALSKEIAFVTPILALGLCFVAPRTGQDRGRRWWWGPLVLAGALLPIAVLRYQVIGGLGGYTENPIGALRVAGAAVSYGLAAVVPHELGILQRPWLLALPAIAVVAGLVALTRLRLRDRRLFAVACLGLAWSGVAVLPVLGEPLDLNTASGERLLLLASVGLSLLLGALLAPLLSRSRARPAAAVAACVLALLCWNATRSWIAAGDLAERAVASAGSLAPPQGTLVLLTFPDSYRNAHVFPNSFGAALARAGVENVALVGCVAVNVREVRSGAISVTGTGAAYRAQASDKAPFDFPVLGDAGLTRPGCTIQARGEKGTIGLKREADITLTAPPAQLAVFDGEKFTPLP